jgi:hypothetical protein
MNYIYKQNGGTCALNAVVNALEKLTGKRISQREINKFYNKYDDEREGMRMREIVKILRKEPIAGYVIDEYRKIYSRFPLFTRRKIGKVRSALMYKDWAVVLGIHTGVKNPKISLDSDYKIIPEKFGSFHAVLATRLKSPRLIEIENSWGKKWGDKGMCYLDIKDFSKVVHSARIISFKKAKL